MRVRLVAGLCGDGQIDSDEVILRAAARGDAQAVRAAIERFAPLVATLARRMLADPSLFEDAVQEVFIELWKAAPRFDPAAGAARTFVATIAKRRLIDRGRSEGSRVRAVAAAQAATPAQEAAGSDAVLASREDAARATRLIEALPDPQREVVRLSLGRGWSHQRIADHLALPLGTVKTTLRRTIFSLREALAAPAASGGAA